MNVQRLRVVLGFVVAALWLPSLSLLIEDWYSAWWVGMVLAWTGPLTIFVAVPLYLLVRKRISFRLCAGAGLCVGLLGAVPWVLENNPKAALNFAPVMMAVGLVSSILFWIIAVWKNAPRAT
jgi:hypothetical protein